MAPVPIHDTLSSAKMTAAATAQAMCDSPLDCPQRSRHRTSAPTRVSSRWSRSGTSFTASSWTARSPRRAPSCCAAPPRSAARLHCCFQRKLHPWADLEEWRCLASGGCTCESPRGSLVKPPTQSSNMVWCDHRMSSMRLSATCTMPWAWRATWRSTPAWCQGEGRPRWPSRGASTTEPPR